MALVEFTLVAGLLIFLLLAVVELSLLLNARVVVGAAAREGARRAAVDGGASPTALRRVEESLRLGRIDPGRAEVRIVPRRARYGGTVRVRVRYAYTPLTVLFRAVTGGSVPLAAEAVTRSERLR